MLRSTRIMGFSALTMGNSGINECVNPSIAYRQAIRWKRKPIWLPTAKSKLFRIPVRPVIPKEELEETKRLYNHYRTAMKSIRRYIIGYVYENEEKLQKSSTQDTVEEDYRRCMYINDEWNKKIAQEREHRLEKQSEERKILAAQKLEALAEQREKMQKLAAERIRKAKADAPHLITRENIDEEIERVLATKVSYDYAIDIHGNIYKDLFKQPQKKEVNTM